MMRSQPNYFEVVLYLLLLFLLVVFLFALLLQVGSWGLLVGWVGWLEKSFSCQPQLHLRLMLRFG